MTLPSSLRRFAAFVLLTFVLIANILAFTSNGARATSNVTTYSQSAVITPPPAGSFTGAAGGDSWSVALSRANVYMAFHGRLFTVMCRVQATAAACPGFSAPIQLADNNGGTFSVDASPEMWIDDTNQKLYAYANQTATTTAGVVCFDIANPASPYCGFTPLSNAGDAGVYSATIASNAAPVMVGSKWYSLNAYSGSGVVGTRNELMCFDTATLAACPGQPYSFDIGTTNVGSTIYVPGELALGSKIIVTTADSTAYLHVSCFDTTTNAECAGNYPFTPSPPLSFGYGTPYPTLDNTGSPTGFCFVLSPSSGNCFDLTGASAVTPTGMTTALPINNYIQGNGYVVLGTRLYVPNAGTNAVSCFDFATGNACANFPLALSSANLLYSVNFDQFEPTCLWVAADNGAAQIQSFDAYTAGQCGSSGTIVPLSTFVNPNPVCMPATYSTLTVTDPAPNTYTNGTAQFLDSSGNPISAIPTQTLDSSGAVDLTSLGLQSQLSLPMVKLDLPGAPAGNVTVSMSWTATYDTACTVNGQQAVDPNTTTTTAPTTTTTAAPTTTTTAAPTTTTTAAPTTTTTQALAFTGSNSNKDALLAIDLIGGGFVALLFVRKRRTTH